MKKTKKCGRAFNLQTTPTIIRRTCESCEPVWIGPHAESCKNTLRLNCVEKPPT